MSARYVVCSDCGRKVQTCRRVYYNIDERGVSVPKVVYDDVSLRAWSRHIETKAHRAALARNAFASTEGDQ